MQTLATTAIPSLVDEPSLSGSNGGVPSSMEEALAHPQLLQLPKEGNLISGSVISVGRQEVYIDCDGLRTGVVRGKEIADESGTFENLEVGERVEATVLALENELGILELSFRTAGHRKAWERLAELLRSGETIQAKVLSANKGGLLVELERVAGFLPVSQLTQEHYPRVAGGDKQKIFEKLQTFIGATLAVKVIDVAETENKLIVSEKHAGADRQSDVLSRYHVGEEIDGVVSGITPFGAFVRFGEGLEGLVHISELAWQRIDNPGNVVALGENVRVKIIGIDNGKISLSRKQLAEDPWTRVQEKYHVGDRVTGKILKTNPFGMFVELDPEIHGLAHISEFTNEQTSDPALAVKPGDTMEFQVISIDPTHHRLGLSRRALDRAPVSQAPSVSEPPTEPSQDSPSPPTPPEGSVEPPAPPLPEPSPSTSTVIASDAPERSNPVNSEETPQ